ncbi:protein GAT2 isoform X2 [Lathyrus oleraceus]|uniref:GATA-type domain-containing protein n=1 Tax=Pisum sativum TaxID=3888 RepID=A0A9D5H190_PEA|nr:protein GAT2-like isoform X2 [Pisum sativum]KAI5448592.1 hypothetical protein KIW84_015847 [Pisum sativum]
MGDYFGKKMDCDIDLNLPLKEVKFKWYPENYSRQNNTTTPLVSQNGTQDMMNISDANKQVHPVAAAAAAADVPTLVAEQGSANHGVPTDPGRRRYRRHGQPLPARPTDPLRFCTNLHCMARKTPMCRSGPIGSRTLCNACGIYYNKYVIRGKVHAIIIHEDGCSSASVPPTQSVERDSSTS